jgi:tRNA pseudouridine55 synthase
VDGVLVVDKPSGPTSHDIVDRARRVLRTRRVGHTGTLDPFATGVLPLCLGRATRLARFLSAGEKTYRATLRLGFATTTDDVTGEPLRPLEPQRAADVTEGAVLSALSAFVGSFDQVPPTFSAKQVAGRRAYELARRGEAVSRAAVPVTVHALELVAREADRLELEVRCSAGTYVRALARDLGERLGCGAHLTALRRTRSGGFGLEQAVPGDTLVGAAQHVVPMARLLTDWPAVRVGVEGRRRVGHGREIAANDVLSDFPGEGEGRVRILDEAGELIALATARGGEGGDVSGLPRPRVLHPDVVLLG